MGNAHWVMVKDDKVFIECEFYEELKVFLTIEQTLYFLAQYRSFLEGNYINPDMPPESIDVEYIAEGEEAAELYETLIKANL